MLTPIGVIDHCVCHGIGSERLVATPEGGNPVEHEDKVIEELFDVVDAWRGSMQLVRANLFPAITGSAICTAFSDSRRGTQPVAVGLEEAIVSVVMESSCAPKPVTC